VVTLIDRPRRLRPPAARLVLPDDSAWSDRPTVPGRIRSRAWRRLLAGRDAFSTWDIGACNCPTPTPTPIPCAECDIPDSIFLTIPGPVSSYLSVASGTLAFTTTGIFETLAEWDSSCQASGVNGNGYLVGICGGSTVELFYLGGATCGVPGSAGIQAHLGNVTLTAPTCSPLSLTISVPISDGLLEVFSPGIQVAASTFSGTVDFVITP
jgi:hypothetical protein